MRGQEWCWEESRAHLREWERSQHQSRRRSPGHAGVPGHSHHSWPRTTSRQLHSSSACRVLTPPWTAVPPCLTTQLLCRVWWECGGVLVKLEWERKESWNEQREPERIKGDALQLYILYIFGFFVYVS